MYVHVAVFIQMLLGARDIGFSEAGVTDSCKLLDVGAGTEPRISEIVASCS